MTITPRVLARIALDGPAARLLVAHRPDSPQRHPVGYALMHMQGTPGTMQAAPAYRLASRDVCGWLVSRVAACAAVYPFGIRVNALNPVAGETPLLKSFMGEDTPEIRAKFLATIPLGRFSTPEDMGNAAAFLCSDEAAMITGAALEVDGGRCI